VNITAFAKITKKYDKVTGWHLAPIYMKEVEYSSFVISKKVNPLHTQIVTSKQHVTFVQKRKVRHLKNSTKFSLDVMFSELSP